MDTFFRKLLDHHKIVVVGFLLAAIVCAVVQGAVKVNHDFSSYLPPDSPSTLGLKKMNEVYDQAIPNVRLLASETSVADARALANSFAETEGVEGVMWLGSVADVREPIETLDPDLIESWTAENGFLFSLTLSASENIESVIAQVRSVADEAAQGEVYMDGAALANAEAGDGTGSELAFVMVIAVLLLLIILSVTSDSWIEPLVFLVVIGVGILLNLGTNIFKGEISNVTQLAASVLQLAISIDYGIVMLHAYRQRKASGLSPYDAMLSAMKHAFSIVSSSAAVTFFGFLSLVFMALALGADMGIVLAKGVFFSFLVVIFFMPCAILSCQKLLEKTKHRILVKNFDGFAKVCIRISIPLTVIAVLLIAPAFLGEKHLDFMYGAGEASAEETVLGRDQAKLNALFEESNQWVLMVPSGQWADEQNLVKTIEALPGVGSVTSYTSTVGVSIPIDVLPETTLSQLIKDGYSRIIIDTTFSYEGSEAFSLVESVRSAAGAYYDEYYTTGNTVVFYDLAQTSTQDINNVVLFSMLAIMLVLLVMYRSLSLPIILTVSIMIATWINLSIPYFMGIQTSYIGYLIISAVQLGATVDYAIIMASEYLENRRTRGTKESSWRAISAAAIPVLTSGLVLTACGFLLYVGSSQQLISDLGLLLGRGALISMAIVFLVLPFVLRIADGLIQKTTWKLNFYQPQQRGNTDGDYTEEGAGTSSVLRGKTNSPAHQLAASASSDLAD